jgi:uncharacterized protein (TIGR03663 family)
MARAVRGIDAVTLAVVGIALVGTGLRLVSLGDRPLHWEEARIGYWTLRYLETGAFEYRPVAGGPLLYVLGRHVIALVGRSDLAVRLPVALIGGALPLAALLFRDRLRRIETVALAVLLAGSPALVYYSRFLHGDVPVAAFALVALGCAVRYYDRGWNGYLYALAGAAALAVASSKFVVGYALCLTAATLLTVDHSRLRGSGEAVREQARAVIDRTRAERGPVAGAVGVFALVHLFFFAPRSGDSGGAHLWDPTTLPAVLQEAFVGAPTKFVGVWLVSRSRDEAGHVLLGFVSHYAELLLATTLPLVVLAAAVALADRYWDGAPRPLLAFAVYWFGVALVVFPIATETQVPWVLVHLTLPLSFPAAVAVGWLVRRGTRAYTHDRAGTLLAIVLVISAVGAATGAAAATAYETPDRTQPMVDYAQPGSDLDPLVADVSAAIAGNDGTDVLYYGPELHLAGDAPADRPPVPAEWGDRLPLAWYFERLGAETDSVADEQALADRGAIPPVVVADRSHRATLSATLDGYDATEYDLALWDRTVVVFVRQ